MFSCNCKKSECIVLCSLFITDHWDLITWLPFHLRIPSSETQSPPIPSCFWLTEFWIAHVPSAWNVLICWVSNSKATYSGKAMPSSPPESSIQSTLHLKSRETFTYYILFVHLSHPPLHREPFKTPVLDLTVWCLLVQNIPLVSQVPIPSCRMNEWSAEFYSQVVV